MVIGPRNTQYYLSRFREQFQTGRASRWHGAACFLTFFWLLYRKLWGWAAAYFFLPGIIFSIVNAALLGVFQIGNAAFALVIIAEILLSFVVPAMMANGIYYWHCLSILHRQRRAAPTRERFLAQVEAAGGTGKAALAAVFLCGLIPMIGILAAIALPAYQDYTKRAKTSEAILSGMSVARQVGDYYTRTGRIPESLESFPPQPSSQYVSRMRIDSRSGIITMDVNFGADSRAAPTIMLIPSSSNGGEVQWACRSNKESQKFVPSSCRD